MHSFEELQEIFSNEIDRYSPAVEPGNLQKPVVYTLGMGGKRIRPVLLLMAAEAFGGKYQDAIPAAMAIEIFHNSTLIHDDIMDEAELRRNQTTVHKQWNLNSAILSGDLMIIKAYEQLNQLNSNKINQVLTVFNKIAAEVCEGQQFDLDFETDDEVSLSDYKKMIRLKTSVLLAGSLKIGAIVGGADTESAKKLYCFGENLGLAFQLQDDYLDAFGNTKSFGKKIGGDIAANKKTFLLLKALELAKGAYHDELTSLLGNNSISESEKIESVLAIYQKLGIKSLTEDEMKKHFEKAIEYLEEIDIDEKYKDGLYELSKKLMGRQT
ncbi:MAG TPA: polyprenyl synthetase family protein [Salinivirga sp.]|uniref:polyprenyl synthetase family protein n=1 Tax=Salinivirga sp. TaxID=1970192 RepID=UPI002B485487|nr:polyprenyl synthetase family protein [Salinivirga sp.]HKK60048.1 polyprenyl synthetase family protein [Salinivirga sp.]